MNKRFSKGHYEFDQPSLYILLLVNAITIIVAVIKQWSLPTILWIYWFQSVIIGLFQARKIYDLKQFSTKSFTLNNKSVQPTSKTKKQTIAFFLIHYNFFHVGYAVFLAGLSDKVLWPMVLYGSVAFFINHLFSYNANKYRDRSRVPNIGQMMFFPYIRILPMHLFIVFMISLSQSIMTLVIFLVLKTLADAAMHAIEHYQSTKVNANR